MPSNHVMVHRGDELYPSMLEDLDDPPETLYVVGDAGAMSTRCLSVIGARRATPYGLVVAEMAGRVAAECGVTVVSGGALGCDTAAQRAALDAGGTVVVVSGTGADVPYPESSRDVFERAAKVGCVVSIAPWGSPPRPFAFPRRNKVIAALSEGLMVTEAGERTGTSSTADCAVELGRNIYAVPGSIFSPESVGSNRLIANGAAIIASEEDLEMRLSLDYGVMRLLVPGEPRRHGRVLTALIASPMRPDDLANRLGETSLDMLRTLADYEMRGVVVRLPDGRYAPTREAYLARDTIDA